MCIRDRVGSSFTDAAGARTNLANELSHWDLDKVKAQAAEAWNKELGRVAIKGSEQTKTLFYTALYHTKHTPRLFSDVDGRYPGFADDSEIHTTKGFDYYCDSVSYTHLNYCQFWVRPLCHQNQTLTNMKSTKTIVLIHGLFVNNTSWEQWKTYFEAQGYKVYTPANPGHEGAPSQLRTTVPVSYTHLDVYKRQGLQARPARTIPMVSRQI